MSTPLMNLTITTPIMTIVKMMEQLIGRRALAQTLAVAPATIAGWHKHSIEPGRKTQVKLQRLYRTISELIVVLPDSEIDAWLRRQNRWLDGQAPMTLLRDHTGPLPAEPQDELLLAARHLIRLAAICERIAAELPIKQVAAGLIQLFSRPRAAELVLSNSHSIKHWAEGTHTPHPRNRQRLRQLAQVAMVIEFDGDSAMVARWMMSRNPDLNDERPRALLINDSDEDYERVLAAAYAFVTLP